MTVLVVSRRIGGLAISDVDAHHFVAKGDVMSLSKAAPGNRSTQEHSQDDTTPRHNTVR